VRGLIRAERLRLRKRGGLQVVVLAIPVLASFFFLAGYQSSVGYMPTFDEQSYRHELIDMGAVQGVPPEEAEQMLDEMVESERVNMQEMRRQMESVWATFAFPQSLLTVLANSTILFFAMILLTATTIGDEFNWGTIRTTLLASGDRRRVLLVRLAALTFVAGLLLAFLLLLGLLLPLVLLAFGATLPTPPPVNPLGLGVLILGDLLVAIAMIGFAALATLMVRSGSLTLVVALVYVAIEAALLGALLQFEPFREDGSLEWLPKLLPVRSIVELLGSASHAAGVVERFPGDVVSRDLGAVWVPLGTVAAWGAAFIALAFRRFRRMDIVE
jgi:ABC-type transport system involved in multi-copper enzyme maturation permease subunit